MRRGAKTTTSGVCTGVYSARRPASSRPSAALNKRRNSHYSCTSFGEEVTAIYSSISAPPRACAFSRDGEKRPHPPVHTVHYYDLALRSRKAPEESNELAALRGIPELALAVLDKYF